jgi:hypothetical protein
MHARLVKVGAFNAAPCLPQVALGLGSDSGASLVPDLLRRVMGHETATCPGPGTLLGRQDVPRQPARSNYVLT